MGERLSRWGVGPYLATTMTAGCAITGAAVYLWPQVCLFRFPALFPLGVALVALGAILWLWGVVTVMRAYNADQLVTTGAFGVVRNPVYAAWMVLILPGVALATGAWPLFLVSLTTYALFKRLIRTEDEYLTKRFGQAYLDYRARVNEVVPMPRKQV